MDSARNRLQSAQDQLERTQNDLKETLEIKVEADQSEDPDLIQEVKESETRQRALIAELEAEIAKLLKPASSSESLRARLAKQREREAQARNFLGSGELPHGLPSKAQGSNLPVANPLVPSLPPVSQAPSKNSTISPRDSLSASQASAQSPSQAGLRGQAKRAHISENEDKLIGEFGGLHTNGISQTPPGAFGSSSIPLNKKPLDLATAQSSASQMSNATSVINNPPKSASEFSLDSFGENAFGGPPSAKSTIKSSPSSPHQSHPVPMESAFRRSEGSGSVKSIPKDDFGFGDSAFTAPSSSGFEPPTFKQWDNSPSGNSSQRPALAEQGRGVSLKDSFPTSVASKSEGPASQWQAFDLSPKPQGPPQNQSQAQGSSAIQGTFSGGFPGTQTASPRITPGNQSTAQDPFSGSTFSQGFSQGIQGAPSAGSDFGLGSFGAPQRNPPTPPRSGNPFVDTNEPSEPQQDSLYGNPAAPSWAGSSAGVQRSTDSSDFGVSGQPQLGGFGFGNAPQNPTPSGPLSNRQPSSARSQQSLGFGNVTDFGAPRNSIDYDPFGPPPSVQQNPGQNQQGFGQNTFGNSQQPGSHQAQGGQELHNGRFGHAGQPYLVTPSAVVIPDSDWDALSQPAAPKPAPVVDEDHLDTDVWVPMGEQDRTKIRSAYEDRYKAQHTGGIGKADALDLYSRGSLSEPFEKLFALADMDRDNRLNFSEFLIYMHALRLLNQKKDAVKLPSKFTHKSASRIIGTDFASLPKLVNTDSSTPTPAIAEEGSEQKVKTLVSRGSSEEDAKRALFLNGDDLTAASEWLETRKSGPKDPGNIPGSLSAFPNQNQPTTSPTATDSSEGPKISLRIDKAILNYKKPVDKPTFAVSIVNSWGEAIGEPLQTPPGSFDRDSGIITFGHTMVLPQGIHKISDDSCIYFELKQFKVKEKKWSTMGWTYRHKINFVKVVDGVKCIRTEAQGLNLYEKPIDLRSHFKQSAMKKMRPLSTTSPDFYLRVAEAP